jgi:NAD(P)-dependent dehydrogenase (short-subunit alcohol dehydrogenase family)
LCIIAAGLWGLVNNAGIGGVPMALEWLSRDDWTSMLSINLMGVVFVTQAFLPLVRQAKGRVVNIASQMGRIAATNAPYCVAKFGVEAFSDALRFVVRRLSHLIVYEDCHFSPYIYYHPGLPTKCELF